MTRGTAGAAGVLQAEGKLVCSILVRNNAKSAAGFLDLLRLAS